MRQLNIHCTKCGIRVALKELQSRLVAGVYDGSIDCHAALEVVEKAIAAPARNCDVGTAEEQEKRFIDYCCDKCDGNNCKNGLRIEDQIYKCTLHLGADALRRRQEVSELIQWPTAKYWTAQWNPIIGCRTCSPACEHCYAAAWAKRFGQSFEPHDTKQRPPRKGVVFCGNMTDLFGEWLPAYMGMDAILLDATEPRCANATYLWLTKRVERMCDEIYGLPTVRDVATLGNHYFGFTAENQEWYDKRRDALYHNWPSWANLWISAEPLLGPIDDMKLGNIVAGSRCRWLVVGCESGPNRRPCKIEWVESIVEQCVADGVPVFVKQLDIGGKCVTDINQFPAHLQVRQVPWVKEGSEK